MDRIAPSLGFIVRFSLAAAFFSFGCGREPIEGTSSEQGTVKVQVEFGSHSEDAAARAVLLGEVNWSDALTVLDATQKMSSDNGVSLKWRGSGATAFVEAIGGVENGAMGKNWIYFVNGKKATQGAGAFVLKNNDVVLWKYSDEVE